MAEEFDKLQSAYPKADRLPLPPSLNAPTVRSDYMSEMRGAAEQSGAMGRALDSMRYLGQKPEALALLRDIQSSRLGAGPYNPRLLVPPSAPFPGAMYGPPPPSPVGGSAIWSRTPEPRALGGPVEPGQPYLVGERGPEVMVPDQPGQVVASNELPPGIYAADKPRSAEVPSETLPPGIYAADKPRETPSVAPPPAVTGYESMSPNELAMLRVQRAAMPVGGRQEGRMSRVVGAVVPAIGQTLTDLNELARRAVTDPQSLTPAETMQIAMSVNPVSVAARTGAEIARGALTPFQLQQRETGVLSIPRVAESGPTMQTAGRGLTGLPFVGSGIRRGAERATQELQAAGEAAAARPTGVVPTQNQAGSVVRDAIKGLGDQAPKPFTQLLNKSNEDIVGRIAQMASEMKSGANVSQLAQLRASVSAEDWNTVRGALVDRFGQSPRTGQFDPATWVRNYGGLSEQGKRVLFGPADDALRYHLDAIEAVSRRAPSWQQFQRERSALGTKVGVVGLAGVVGGTIASPLATLSAMVPLGALGRYLSRPMTAAPIAQWSRAYERVVKTAGAPQAIAGLTLATRNLNNTLGTDVKVEDVLKGPQNGQSLE